MANSINLDFHKMVSVELTPKGKEILIRDIKKRHKDIISKDFPYYIYLPETTENGYFRMHLYYVMKLYGRYLWHGKNGCFTKILYNTETFSCSVVNTNIFN
jgi:hypothetical protein